MEFKAKIKSIPINLKRGTRLFPTQILTNDSNKSIDPQDNLSNSSYTVITRSFLEDNQPAIQRPSNRHTTDITGSKPDQLRLSLDRLNKNRAWLQQDSCEGSLSGRLNYPKIQSQINANNGSVVQNEAQSTKKVTKADNQFDAFKELCIQKIISNQTKVVQRLSEAYNKNTEQTSNRQSLDSKNEIACLEQQYSINNIWERLYTQYKEKYTLIEKDYQELVVKMKDCDLFAEALRKDNQNLLENIQKQCLKIDQQAKKIVRLEESIKINRNINQQLMKKDKQFQRKIKLLEDNAENYVKGKLDEVKAQTILQQKEKYDEKARISERQVFQLKLRVIDQGNQLEEVQKDKQKLRISFQGEINSLLEQMSNVINEKMNIFSQFSVAKMQVQGKNIELAELNHQNNHLKAIINHANEEISKLTAEIIRIDQLNMHLDQQNVRISDEYHRCIAESQEKICQLSNHCNWLERQKEELIECLEDKDGELAQLNIAKNNALIQLLSVKGDLKKKRQTQQKERKESYQQSLQQIIAKNQLIQKELEIANQQLSMKNKQLSNLQSQSAIKSQKMQEEFSAILAQNQQLKEQVLDVKLDHENQFKEKWRQHESLLNENLLFKLQALQQIRKSAQQNEKLSDKLNMEEQISSQLRLQNAKIEQQREILERLIKTKVETILHLNEQINILQKKQIQRSEEIKEKQIVIQSRQNELKEVEQQYLELIQGELKKIQSINDNQWDVAEAQFTDRFSITPSKNRMSRSNQQLEEGLSPQQSPVKNCSDSASSPKEEEIQVEIEELRMKVEELNFVNQALQNKVQSLSDLEENSNAIIFQKIRSFQESLEKTLHEKQQVELKNAEILQKVTELTEKCIIYEGKIQWLENTYRIMQENLFETQQELVKSNFQYVNLKLMKESQNQEQIQVCEKKRHEIDAEDTLLNPEPDAKILEELTQQIKELQQQRNQQELNKIEIHIIQVSSDSELLEQNVPQINIITVNSDVESLEQQKSEVKEQSLMEQKPEIQEKIQEDSMLNIQSCNEQQLNNEQLNTDFTVIIEDIVKRIKQDVQKFFNSIDSSQEGKEKQNLTIMIQNSEEGNHPNEKVSQ